MLAETQARLEKALKECDNLTTTITTNEKKFESECQRLNTEIERLNNILKATNGNMQEQILKLNDQIKKLLAEIVNLKDNVNRLEKEKSEEMGKAEKARIGYEAKIKDLEEQIAMLQAQSGDIVGQLQEKIRVLMETHEREKTHIE